ncbi:MAG: exodeoxyribonuclease I [Pantoea sp. Brub]|nr:exodeoxyribonuclease I [Pantoea sp. Brub]
MHLSKSTFIFHDYETFGTSPSLDRPAQFASVKTDSEFNPIEDPQIFYCRIPNDYLPQPKAVVTTGITPQIVTKNGFIEPEFAKRIYNIFTFQKSCIVGYNNMKFDEEVTRNIFYRNFYDPYDWSWKNGNSKWDIINVMRACYALRPDGIYWPKNEKGFTSFRLTDLTRANNLIHNNAHNALSDVYATIALAKLVKKQQPQLFSFLFNNRTKEQLISIIDIIKMQPLVYISNVFGSSCGNTSWIVPLAWHPNNYNSLIVVDLSKNIYPLLKFDVCQLSKLLYRKKTELDHLSSIPLQLIQINKCPILTQANILRHEDALRLGIDREYCLNNLLLLRKFPEIRKKVILIFTKLKPFITSDNVDNQLYESFFSNGDKLNMNIIRKTEPSIIANLNLNFENHRMEKLLFRYRARNFPQTLNLIEKKNWLEHRQKVFNHENIKKFFLELQYLKCLYKTDSNKLKILKNLSTYVKNMT